MTGGEAVAGRDQAGAVGRGPVTEGAGPEAGAAGVDPLAGAVGPAAGALDRAAGTNAGVLRDLRTAVADREGGTSCPGPAPATAGEARGRPEGDPATDDTGSRSEAAAVVTAPAGRPETAGRTDRARDRGSVAIGGAGLPDLRALVPIEAVPAGAAPGPASARSAGAATKPTGARPALAKARPRVRRAMSGAGSGNVPRRPAGRHGGDNGVAGASHTTRAAVARGAAAHRVAGHPVRRGAPHHPVDGRGGPGGMRPGQAAPGTRARGSQGNHGRSPRVPVRPAGREDGALRARRAGAPPTSSADPAGRRSPDGARYWMPVARHSRRQARPCRGHSSGC